MLSFYAVSKDYFFHSLSGLIIHFKFLYTYLYIIRFYNRHTNDQDAKEEAELYIVLLANEVRTYKCTQTIKIIETQHDFL